MIVEESDEAGVTESEGVLLALAPADFVELGEGRSELERVADREGAEVHDCVLLMLRVGASVELAVRERLDALEKEELRVKVGVLVFVTVFEEVLVDVAVLREARVGASGG